MIGSRLGVYNFSSLMNVSYRINQLSLYMHVGNVVDETLYDKVEGHLK